MYCVMAQRTGPDLACDDCRKKRSKQSLSERFADAGVPVVREQSAPVGPTPAERPKAVIEVPLKPTDCVTITECLGIARKTLSDNLNWLLNTSPLPNVFTAGKFKDLLLEVQISDIDRLIQLFTSCHGVVVQMPIDQFKPVSKGGGQ
jgi:hypothetical protein